MRYALKPHPDFHSDAAIGIEVEVLGGAALALRYLVTGEIGALRLPEQAVPARKDELWRHTCFEAFLRPSSGPSYYEFNFSPSTEWAAYRFDNYRAGMTVAREIAPPRIEVSATNGNLILEVSLDGLPFVANRQLGLSAVIEEKNGRKSYWALAHPEGKPDFHHSDCFALQLPGT